MQKVTLIKGDGIGPSIMDAATKIIEASGVPIEWEERYAGVSAFDRFQSPLPDETLESIKRTRVVFKGPLTTQLGKGFRSINVALRQEFDLYANVRPAKSWKGAHSRYDNIDLVVIRENTEGLYAGLEHYIGPKKNTAESIAVITREGTERIIKFAFEYARQNRRKKITVAHKANILKYSQGLFLDVAQEVAKIYPEIECDERIIDATCMHLVMDPNQFDMIVTTNMFGDILSDLIAGLVGGLGLAPGANIGYDTALFEAVHGSAPDIAGKNIANPTALILGGIMMLRYLGETLAADRINRAVEAIINEGRYVTPDLNPDSRTGTAEMAEAIIGAMN
ncbi:MAG: isocitrate/isopropylmalate family dehydrogenase [Methylococcaceae bacterium]|nr:isocitrate/isopropylmalate family dehydrogenase [Methylococcaceae bacterium]